VQKNDKQEKNGCHSEILCGGLRGGDEESPESEPLAQEIPRRCAFLGMTTVALTNDNK